MSLPSDLGSQLYGSLRTKAAGDIAESFSHYEPGYCNFNLFASIANPLYDQLSRALQFPINALITEELSS